MGGVEGVCWGRGVSADGEGGLGEGVRGSVQVEEVLQ